MPCYSLEGVVPVVDPTAFVHPSAVLIGDVVIGAGCYVGPCASLRGDFCRIELRPGSNVQDTCVLHGFPGMNVVVEENGHVGHGAVLHSCIVGRDALIGINAVVMDEADIGAEAIVAACAFVKAGMQVPPRTLAGGVPAKIMRELTDEEIAWKLEGTLVYQELTRRCLRSLQETPPLSELDIDRPRLVVPDVKPLITTRRGSGAE
jgi:phenylacetic acid degradation protein